MATTLDAKIPTGPLAEKWQKHKNESKLVSPANKRKLDVIVVGSGLAGGSAAATLGEEVKRSSFTIPRVLVGTVLAAGFVFTLVTAAQTLVFGTDPGGVARFSGSTSLLAVSCCLATEP